MGRGEWNQSAARSMNEMAVKSLLLKAAITSPGIAPNRQKRATLQFCRWVSLFAARR